MGTSNNIALALIAGFIVYTTVRGELPAYLCVLGIGNGCVQPNQQPQVQQQKQQQQPNQTSNTSSPPSVQMPSGTWDLPPLQPPPYPSNTGANGGNQKITYDMGDYGGGLSTDKSGLVDNDPISSPGFDNTFGGSFDGGSSGNGDTFDPGWGDNGFGDYE